MLDRDFESPHHKKFRALSPLARPGLSGHSWRLFLRIRRSLHRHHRQGGEDAVARIQLHGHSGEHRLPPYKHKTSKKRRDWRKLHIGVDAEGFIVAVELTASSRDDASTLPDLLAPLEVPIRRFTADGAYDHRSVYDRASAAGTENVVIVIPPRRSAPSAGPTDGPWAQREASLQRIRKVGRREWQKESGYRQQARVENSFFRYKSVFGGDLKARHSKAQRREAAIGCHILNRMAELGRPSSYALGR